MCSYRNKKWFKNWTLADWIMLAFMVAILTLLGVNAYETWKDPCVTVSPVGISVE